MVIFAYHEGKRLAQTLSRAQRADECDDMERIPNGTWNGPNHAPSWGMIRSSDGMPGTLMDEDDQRLEGCRLKLFRNSRIDAYFPAAFMPISTTPWRSTVTLKPSAKVPRSF